MRKIFGNNLRQERKKQHLTVQTIANVCEKSRSYITLIENGRRLPGKKLLPKIASALGIKVTEILNWYLESIREEVEKDLMNSRAGNKK